MHRLAGILFQMQAFNPNLARCAIRHVEAQHPLTHDWLFVLADLITLRQIGIKIVLSVKHADQIDLGIQPQTGPYCLVNTFLVDHRQHAGHGCINKADIGVRLGSKSGWRTGKQLGAGLDLRMHLKPDHHFPFARAAFDKVTHDAPPARRAGNAEKPAASSITRPTL
ncbi:MAG: Uncharacterised protein [SAR116 cluster bacterium]|nr:MAG: Uncharacterised protein [SAR116 cluster bacterium]